MKYLVILAILAGCATPQTTLPFEREDITKEVQERDRLASKLSKPRFPGDRE